MAEVNQEQSARERRAKGRELKFVFYGGMSLYLVCLVVLGVIVRNTWFYFALVIGAFFVLIAFYYYHDNFMVPALQEIKSGNMTETAAVMLRLGEWLMPAIALQCFVVVGFWMTVQRAPFADSLYTHPYLYGLQYKKLERLMQPEIERAGLVFNLRTISLDSVQEMKTAAYLLDTFGSYVKDCPDLVPAAAGQGSGRGENGKQLSLHGAELIRAIVSCIYKIPYFIALTFGFLGALMYALNDMRHRFFITDLYPKTYVGYLIRFIFTPALCMVIAYFFMNDWITNLAPALFFMVGFFPQLALQFLEDKTRKILRLEKNKKKEIPLGLLQGMTDYIVYRFNELGIGDVQNLAYADLNYLRKNWSNDRLLCDFVAQSLLLIHFPEDFATLQGHGIRSIISFENIVPEELTEEEEKNFGVPTARLQGVRKLVATEPLKSRIKMLEKIIESFEDQELNMINKTIVQMRPAVLDEG